MVSLKDFLKNLKDLNMNSQFIKDIFVELEDIGFTIIPIINNDKLTIEIKKEIASGTYAHFNNPTINPNVRQNIVDTLKTVVFKYDEISEPVEILVSYIESVWGSIKTIYEFEYIFHWNRDIVEDGYMETPPDNDTDIIIMNIIISKRKEKKDNFFKRFLKKFENFEYETS